MRHTQIGEAYPGSLGPLVGPRIAAMDAEANARLERELTRPQATHCRLCSSPLMRRATRFDASDVCLRCMKRIHMREYRAAAKASR